MHLQILGSGQDAGTPHTGCFCEICNSARKSPKHQRLGPSVAIYDANEKFCYLIDASPDFKVQLEIIMKELKEVKREGRTPISGILLTHAHLGHIAGLWHLGWEALAEKSMPLLCTPKMSQFLQTNYPYNLMVARNNIKIQELKIGEDFALDGIKWTGFEVPHRNEIADTVGFRIESDKRVIYLPDLDHWTDSALNEIKNADIAVVDGSFYRKTDFHGYSKVPHPPIQETIELLENVKTDIYFTHINHTNPVNFDGTEKKYVLSKGFDIAYDGLRLEI